MDKTTDLAIEYLKHRRKFGYALKIEGQQLLRFARFADDVAPGKPLRLNIALKWATQPTGRSRLYHAKRLELIRGFARYCRAIDPRTEVPPPRLLGPAHNRVAPHIYSPSDLHHLQIESAKLGRKESLRVLTLTTVIGLAASTGMRCCELLRLRVTDLDAIAATLRVAPAKFSPERILPLHSTVVAALQRYLKVRGRSPVFTDRLFVGRNGHALADRTLHEQFRRTAQGLVATGARPRPRLHDFRHTFATSWIAEWSRLRAPVAHHLLSLSRYLGHRHFAETFWYVSSDPQTLVGVGTTFQRYFRGPARHPSYEPSPIPVARAAILRRAPPRPAEPEPSNRGRIPRYLPAFSAVSI